MKCDKCYHGKRYPKENEVYPYCHKKDVWVTNEASNFAKNLSR